VFLSAAALMPNEFNWTTLFILLGVAALWILWNHDGGIQAGQFLGMFVSAPSQLEKIVQDTSGKIGVVVRNVLVMRSQSAQAYALPQTHKLIFTERILELLSDEELATVCAHEIGHLTESRREYYARYIIVFSYLPWLLLKPLTHSIGFFGFYLPLLNMVVTPKLYRRISRRLEERADKIARTVN
jgi:Zn-dependent protease with chaperone function